MLASSQKVTIVDDLAVRLELIPQRFETTRLIWSISGYLDSLPVLLYVQSAKGPSRPSKLFDPWCSVFLWSSRLLLVRKLPA